MIRVLVVDDSAFARKVLREILAADPEMEVVGQARDGLDALEKVERLRPDVVTLDLQMPALDGPGFLRAQRERRPLRVVVVSSLDEEADPAVEAMQLGAAEYVRKPTAVAQESLREVGAEVLRAVRAAAASDPGRLAAPVERASWRAAAPGRVAAVALGLSTGGPRALRFLLSELGTGFRVPLAAVIHMPPGYTAALARSLGQSTALEVVEARDGLEMAPGRVILARAGVHLVLARRPGGVAATLEPQPAGSLHRPSVDELLRSAAACYGSGLVAGILTGMGRDGAEGAAWVKAAGGRVFTEDESTCVVYGMPRSVDEAGLSDVRLPLGAIPGWLRSLARGHGG